MARIAEVTKGNQDGATRHGRGAEAAQIKAKEPRSADFQKTKAHGSAKLNSESPKR